MFHFYVSLFFLILILALLLFVVVIVERKEKKNATFNWREGKETDLGGAQDGRGGGTTVETVA